MRQCIKVYFIFIWSSTCFGRHTAHHQEPKTALAVFGCACVEGCWTCSCWTLSGRAFYKYEINFDTLLHLVGFFIWITKILFVTKFQIDELHCACYAQFLSINSIFFYMQSNLCFCLQLWGEHAGEEFSVTNPAEPRDLSHCIRNHSNG